MALGTVQYWQKGAPPMLDQVWMEQQLSQLPLFQYGFLTPDQLVFTERVRHVCEQECPMYNSSWACPPAVGSVEECKARCLSYPQALMITTVTEVADIENMELTLATRGEHEAVTHQVEQLFQQQGCQTMVLSTESCAVCQNCAWPDAPCRHPERMYPCVESHGILVTELAELFGMEFFNGNIVTWFSLIFFR